VYDANDGIDMQYLTGVSAITQDKKEIFGLAQNIVKPRPRLSQGDLSPDINEQPAGGVYRYDGKSWQEFTTKDGLVNVQF